MILNLYLRWVLGHGNFYCENISKTTKTQSAESRHQHSPRHGGVRCKGGFGDAGEKAPSDNIVNSFLAPMVADVGKLGYWSRVAYAIHREVAGRDQQAPAVYVIDRARDTLCFAFCVHIHAEQIADSLILARCVEDGKGGCSAAKAGYIDSLAVLDITDVDAISRPVSEKGLCLFREPCRLCDGDADITAALLLDFL